MSRLTLASLPLAITDGSAGPNIALLEGTSGLSGTDILLCPELWTSGFLRRAWPECADEADETLRRVAAFCRRAGTALAGSIVVRDEATGTLRNRLVFLDDRGENLGHYDKAHLFRPFQEQEDIAPGDRIVVVEYRGFRFGLAICYDLRFPEMFRNLRLQGAEVFLVSAQWPKARAENLEILARARAIENACYLVLSNRTGPASDGTEFGGEAVVVGPDGAVLARNGRPGEMVQAEITTACIKETRSFLRVIEERRPGVDDVTVP